MRFFKITLITSLVVYLIYSFIQFDLSWFLEVPTWSVKDRFGIVTTSFFTLIISLFIWAVVTTDID